MTKLQRLRDNIEAIRHALTGGGEYDKDVLVKYSGFGGLGFVLNPLDRAAWSKSDMDCYDDTARLHDLLRSASKGENEYQAWVQSLKASVLTAYYTPRLFVQAVFTAIDRATGKGSTPAFGRILDPAAGNGVFAECASGMGLAQDGKTVAYEKDMLTGLLLSRLHPEMDIRVAGFETIPAGDLGGFDLVATNVPFGDIRVFDPEYSESRSEVRRDAARMIHRYYVMKGLDCLRDGGLEVYIITSNYLNRDSEQLAEALRQARLIGAYRLANNLFRESGTEVGTDLLVMQKDMRKQGLTADESMLLTKYEDDGCPTNLYFSCYPERVIATSRKVDTDAYGKPGLVYLHKDGVGGIAADMGRELSKDLAVSGYGKEAGQGGGSRRRAEADGGSRSKAKSRKAKQGRTKAPRKVRLMKVIYTCYTMLYDYEATKMEENTALRKRLNRLYDAFTADYGPLNYSRNRLEAETVSADLLSLEYRDEEKGGRWQKADIFIKPVAFSTDDMHEAGTPQEALAQSLNDYGRPDMRYMTALTGMGDDELLTALDGEVFWNPLNGEFEIKARFVCGDVIEKLEQIKQRYPKVAQYLDGPTDGQQLPALVVPEEVRVLQAMRALQDAIPTPIPFDDLDFNLGERWIDPQLYGDFATEFFAAPTGDRPSWQTEPFKVTVKYQPLLDQFAASSNYTWGNESITTKYAVRPEAGTDLDGIDLLVHALHNTCPKLMKYKRDADGRCEYNEKNEKIKVEDPEKTQLANTKIEEIRQGFVDWLQRQPKEIRENLAAVYNRRFNCFVKPKYDGSFMTFPGIDMEGLREKYGIASIYGSQKDCVWMLMQNGGGICDHEVGSGKTLIMCMAAHEMKRLGLAHKPMIIGLKANVSAIAETYRTAYPEARILFARERDYSGAERVNFFNRMKNNDYDCVIMSHDQFSRLPQSDEIQMETLQDEVRQLEESLKVINGWGYEISRRVRRGLEIRKRNMEAKIRSLQNAISKQKDRVVDFGMMGIDHIFVDESHQFKNLGFSTRHDRVAGMGNSEGSKRAYNLLMAIRTIQKRTGRDLGATFLSGTTVTNSLTELYSLFRYLRPKALAKQNITCFDAWAAIFTKKSQEFEFSITNQIVLKERFRYFIKVPELAMFYNEITDFRTAEDVGIERPEKHAMLLNIKPTPDQEAFIKTLMEFAQTGDFRLIGMADATDKQQKAKMLYATDLARKMSLDMRMIDPTYGDHPRSKASRCAQLVKRYYDRYSDVKGTQLIFSDLSTYQGDGNWNVYEEIKRKLVSDYGIPASEIRFIQECKCDSKKQNLIADVNAGRVRVLFGSTSMLGTGVNAQQRVVAVHHLDTPWRPSDLEQRDGRAIRRGNEIAKLYADNKVDVIIYAVERSLDSYKFNLLHCKQTFINQLKRGQLNIRTLDEGSMEENGGMNFSEYMAILSGNTDLLERAKLEKRIAALEGERKNFIREQREQEEKQHRLMGENETHRRNIASAKEDLARYNKAVRLSADGTVVNDITLTGFTVPAGLTADELNTEIGKQLFSIEKTARTNGQPQQVGTVYGFPLVVKTSEHYSHHSQMTEYENRFYVEGGRLMYSYNDGYLNKTSPRLSAGFPLLALQRIAEIIDGWQQKIEKNTASIEQLRSILGQAWPKEDELRKLRADLGQLDRKINNELKSEPKAAA